MENETKFLQQAITLAYENCKQGGRPFAALIVRDHQVIASGVNDIIKTHDPTAHAEIQALRAASQKLGSANLQGCTVFASGHPCPMCMAAMYLAGIKAVYYAYSNQDGEAFGLSSAMLYSELAKPFTQQSMQIFHLPVQPETPPHLYVYWKSLH